MKRKIQQVVFNRMDICTKPVYFTIKIEQELGHEINQIFIDMLGVDLGINKEQREVFNFHLLLLQKKLLYFLRLMRIHLRYTRLSAQIWSKFSCFLLVRARVSFETSFNSKQPKLQPKTSFGTIRNKTFVSVVSLLYRNREFRCFD